MNYPPLDQFQRKAVDELANGKILCGGVGVGKSRVAAAYYVEREAPKDVYVITTAKKRDSFDWDAEFVGFGVSGREGQGFHGKLTVDSWNNLGKYADVKGAFFILDEQRLVGSGAWTKAFLKIVKNNNWILLSATPGDTWIDYIPVFVGNGFYKNRTEFIREHVIYNSYSKFPKIDRYVGVGRLVKYRHQLLVEMPYERHTTRNFHYVLVEHDEDLLDKAVKNRWDVFTNEPMKDVAALFRVMRRIVNSHPSRLSAVEKLMTVHPRLIVFYNFDYELEELRTLGLTTARPRIESSTGMSQRSSVECVEQSSSPSSKMSSTTGEDGRQSLECSSQTDTPSLKSRKPSSKTSQHSLQQDESVSKFSNEESSGTSSTETTSPSLENCHPSTEKGATTSENLLNQSLNSSPSETSPIQNHSNACEAETTSQIPNSDAGKVVVAEWNGHRHDPVPSAKRWVYLVNYTAGAEGWNCVDTDAMIFYSLTYSYRNFAQAQGRIDRRNTPFSDLHYYVLRSKAKIDEAIWKALRSKKNFNERSFEKVV